jgi:hypothetical protein
MLEQVGQGLGIGEVVDSHDFDVLRLQRRPKEHATDPTESVDAYTNAHGQAPCENLGKSWPYELYGGVDDASNC